MIQCRQRLCLILCWCPSIVLSQMHNCFTQFQLGEHQGLRTQKTLSAMSHSKSLYDLKRQSAAHLLAV